MEIIVDQPRRLAFEKSIKAMIDFKAAFGRGLSSDFVAELYAANELGLKVVGLNQSGYDALGPNNERYQIKFRSDETQSVDLNNFDFDYLVLVNLGDAYQLTGMWRISVTQAKEIFVERVKFRKYQTTQNKIKSVAERLMPTGEKMNVSDPILKLAAGVYEGLSQEQAGEIEQIALDRRDFFSRQPE